MFENSSNNGHRRSTFNFMGWVVKGKESPSRWPPPHFGKNSQKIPFFFGRPPLGKPSFKKNLFCEKVSQTGGRGGHLDFIPLFFLQYNVKAPKYSPPKKISFHKSPTGGGGHRFMKLFRKIDFFLNDGFPKMWFFCMEIDYWTNQWWFVPFLAFGGPLGGPGGPGGFLGGQENPKLSISIWDQIKLWDAGFWAKTTCHTMFLIFQAQSGPLGPKKGKFGPI